MSTTSRRGIFVALVAFVITTLLFLTHTSAPRALPSFTDHASPAAAEVTPNLSGHAIAPKLGNETLKAELGRAAWKLFHTTFAQFPDKPTADESAALRTYIHLFQRLYPCGECATHFGKVLKKYPPQVSSRNVAAAWGCHVHNVVNKRLKKKEFDCAKIGDFYDCGCAEDKKDKKGATKKKVEKRAGMGKLEVERMGLTKGG